MKKIVVFCAGGMSSSLLINRMRDTAAELKLDCEINAYGTSSAGRCGTDADVILLAPQVRLSNAEIMQKCPGVPVQVIEMMDYGTMNGKKVVSDAIALMGERGEKA